MKKLFVSLYIFSLVLLNSGISLAQTTEIKIIDAEKINYIQLNKNISDIEGSLISGKATTDGTVDYIKTLNDIQSKVLEAKKIAEQNLGFVQKRIEALGASPADGTKETYAISVKRKQFNSEASLIKSKIAEADVVLAKIDEIENLILNTRNKALLGSILDQQNFLVNPSSFWKSTKEFAVFIYEIIESPFVWYSNLSIKEKAEARESSIQAIIYLLVSLITAVYLSRFIQRKFGYDREIENPDYSTKVFAGIYSSIAYGVIPAAIIGAFMLWIRNNAVMNIGFFGLVLDRITLYLLYIFLSQAIVKVTFTPQNGKWRLIEVADEKAKSISRILFLSIILISTASFLEDVASKTNHSEELMYYIKMISNVVKATCLILVTHKSLGDGFDVEEEMTDEEVEEGEDLSLSSKITIFISIFVAGVFSMSLFGYIALSEFILNRSGLSILVVGFFYILNRAIKVIFHRLLLLRFWTRKLKIGRRNLVKADVLFGLFLSPIMLFMASLILLGLWGVSIDLLLQNIKKFLMGFDVGGMRISIVSILFGIFVFFVSLAVFKAVGKSLFSGVLVKLDMDDGIRNSMASGFNFLGFIISLLLTIVIMGGSLSSLAIIAGALSFGVGLGMQNMVTNFISGIILLFERPMKIGDWVIINGQEGIVKQINIRATELETFAKSNVIIPNGNILSNSLINMTHHDKQGRVDVKVGVAYDSDLKLVKEILFDIAKTNKRVLASPAPIVTLSNLGDSSLDFELRCYTSDVSNGYSIASDLRESIVSRFAAAKIEIPFPISVVQNAGAGVETEAAADVSTTAY